MKNLFDITGKVAIVTGASSGLGQTFARALADGGAKLALMARREEKLAAFADELHRNFDAEVLTLKCDVTKDDDVRAAVADVTRRFGRIDILINNAGVATSETSVDHDPESWRRVIDTNLNATFFVSREVAKFMKKNHYGRIINLGSIHSRVAMPGLPIAAYAASKGGVMMLTKALAAEWATDGITVNAIGPSYFPSEMTGGALKDPAFAEFVKKKTPIGRIGRPEELAGAIIYFASDASSFTTGQLLNIDGGWTAV
jgi:gluconate 5-dehydrogenase